MKTLAESSESHQDRSVDAIHNEQERESCNNCGKQQPRNKCPAYGTLRHTTHAMKSLQHLR